MEESILKEIGLTTSEIKVYISLLKTGPARASEVIDKSGLQNPVVHRAFHSLINKGIVSYSISGKIKFYHPIDPTQLLKILEEKKNRLSKIIPELKNLFEYKSDNTKATIHQGKRGVRELLNYLLENTEGEILSYGAPEKSIDVLGDYFWDSFHKKRIKKKIFARMIFHDSASKRANELNKINITNIRTTDKDFEELVETIITKDKVGIIIYLDDPLGILIDDELAAKSYQNFFEILWKGCER